jgi:hypothetical protein
MATKVRVNQIFGISSGGSLPAPFFQSVTPNFSTPNNNEFLIIKGSFFTPGITVIIGGCTTNSVTFISDNEIKVSITTGDTEGNYPITLNNGEESLFTDKFLISQGQVFQPLSNTDWINSTGLIDITPDGQIKLNTYGQRGTAEWSQVIDITKNFEIWFSCAKSDLDTVNNGGTYRDQDRLEIRDAVNNTLYWQIDKERLNWYELRKDGGSGTTYKTGVITNPYPDTAKLKYINGVWELWRNDETTAREVITGHHGNLTNNLIIKASVKWADIDIIKYIELP